MLNKCKALESSWNQPRSQSMEKLSSTELVPGVKKVGGCWSRVISGREKILPWESPYHSQGVIGVQVHSAYGLEQLRSNLNWLQESGRRNYKSLQG